MTPVHLKYIREIVEHPYNRERKLRALLRYLGWNLGRRMLSEADYMIELVPGTCIVISNRENYATLAYTCRLYDFEDMLFLLHALRAGDCFGDLGANVGVYSVLAASRGASVIAVEPVPRTFERLCANLRLNRASGIPVNCGLSDRRQKLAFTTDRGGMNKVARSNGANVCQVDVITVDELVASTGLKPCFLKIDVEGYEMPLLKGAGTLLESGLLAIIIEMNESGREYGFTDLSVHQLLLSHGFSPYRYDPLTRRIEARNGINRSSFNTLYLKDAALPALQQRVVEGESVDLPIGRI